MDFMSHYDGSYRGKGRFRPHGPDESHSVTYDLFQSSEALRHPGGGEVRRKLQLTGQGGRGSNVRNPQEGKKNTLDSYRPSHGRHLPDLLRACARYPGQHATYATYP